MIVLLSRGHNISLLFETSSLFDLYYYGVLYLFRSVIKEFANVRIINK